MQDEGVRIYAIPILPYLFGCLSSTLLVYSLFFLCFGWVLRWLVIDLNVFVIPINQVFFIAKKIRGTRTEVSMI